MTDADQNHVLKLKVTLRDSKPPIWRRLLMPETMTLARLHDAIQAVMNWDNSHLHQFEINRDYFGDPRVLDGGADEARYRLSRLIKDGVRKFSYTYDFGDNWEHTILVEGREPMVPGMQYPACIAGKRNGPPEDCGGIWGYYQLLEIQATPDHPEREERMEWLGGEHDPEDFSVEAANAKLAARFAPVASRPSRRKKP
jgi:hypothetical protein